MDTKTPSTLSSQPATHTNVAVCRSSDPSRSSGAGAASSRNAQPRAVNDELAGRMRKERVRRMKGTVKNMQKSLAQQQLSWH